MLRSVIPVHNTIMPDQLIINLIWDYIVRVPSSLLSFSNARPNAIGTRVVVAVGVEGYFRKRDQRHAVTTEYKQAGIPHVIFIWPSYKLL